MPEFVSTSVAAAIVGLSERHFTRLVKAGVIKPAGREGIANRFRYDDVIALRDQRDKPAPGTRLLTA